MKRRTFHKKSTTWTIGVIATGATVNCTPKMARKNWAGNLQFKASKLAKPQDTTSLQKVLQGAGQVKALGTAHSFNDIADSQNEQLTLTGWQSDPVLDESKSRVTIDANMRYGELALWLQDHGYAVHNLASLPHISIAGACATATHGSGDRNGNLATAVVALDIMRADGSVDHLDREKQADEFNATVVGLGALGIITRMTLRIEPTFNVRQDLFLDLPLDQLRSHFDDITSAGYSVSFFTDWQSDHINQIWVKSKLVDGEAFKKHDQLFGAKAADRKIHPIIAIDPVHCTEQMGQPGPWHERLPHFRLEFTPSSGEELQSEYFVPRRHAVDAIMAIQKLGPQVGPHILISEIRTIAADQLWLSPCYQDPCIAIHFTWKQHIKEVRKLLSVIETALMPYEVRPHWGKLFNVTPQHLAQVYVRLRDFRELVQKRDPQGKFRNAYLERNIFAP